MYTTLLEGMVIIMKLSKKALSISPSPTLSIDAKYKGMLADGEDVVGFGAGEPDFDTPDNIKAAAIDAIHKGFTKYTPASGTLELKRQFAKNLKMIMVFHINLVI